MDKRALDHRIDQVAALGEPARRGLYQYVSRAPAPVSREQAAAALGIAHHVAKFHLDRLVADGLLEFEYRRPPGRGGPGAGRPAKVYRAVGELDVTVPERRYDLAGRLLVRAIAAAERSSRPVSDTVVDTARAAGEELARSTSGPRRARLHTVLESCGFEPRVGRHEITLQNCPFHRLAEEDRELVCGMNLAFVRGVLDGLDATDASARLDPVAGGCCVRISTRR